MFPSLFGDLIEFGISPFYPPFQADESFARDSNLCTNIMKGPETDQIKPSQQILSEAIGHHFIAMTGKVWKVDEKILFQARERLDPIRRFSYCFDANRIHVSCFLFRSLLFLDQRSLAKGNLCK